MIQIDYDECKHGRSFPCHQCLQERITELEQWIADLQSGMFINCVYCGHRYGPDPGTPVAMADVLKEHIERCPRHPMSTLKAENKRLQECLKRLEWSMGDGIRKRCPICRAIAPDTILPDEFYEGHKPDCWLAVEIARGCHRKEP